MIGQVIIDEPERIRIQRRVDELLTTIGKPKSKIEAFACQQFLIDKALTSCDIKQLMDALDNLSKVAKEWFPKAFFEVNLLSSLRQDLRQMVMVADQPITLSEASSKSGKDLMPLNNVLHRFVKIGVFSSNFIKKHNHFKYESSTFDNNLLRQEWDWLWALPFKQISHCYYDDEEFLEEINQK